MYNNFYYLKGVKDKKFRLFTCNEALEIKRFPSAEMSTLWSCCSGIPFFSHDILGGGAAAGGEQRNDAADPASTEVETGDMANCFFRSEKNNINIASKNYKLLVNIIRNLMTSVTLCIKNMFFKVKFV